MWKTPYKIYKSLQKKIRNRCSHIETTDSFDDTVWVQNVTLDIENDMVFNTCTHCIFAASLEREGDSPLSRRIRKRQAYLKYMNDNNLRPYELPTIKIAWGNSIIYKECAICCEDIIQDRKVLRCKHEFHKKCIKEWFKYKRICPYCRRKP